MTAWTPGPGDLADEDQNIRMRPNQTIGRTNLVHIAELMNYP